jgi:probable HAF family extracellular repeat protein
MGEGAGSMFTSAQVRWGLVCAVWLASAPFAYALPTYTITELQPPSFYNSDAAYYGLNNSGQVVGSVTYVYGFSSLAVRWSGGTVADLGDLPGFSRAAAGDINSSGQIVGACFNSANSDRAFLYTGGSMTPLPLPPAPYNFGTGAGGINDAGQVIFNGSTTQGYYRAYLWSGGTVTALGTLGGASSGASDINNSGVIVGGTFTASNTSRAFRWSNGTMFDLGTLPGDVASSANAINDLGQIVGTSRPTNPSLPSRAVLWTGGGIVNLGVLPSYAYSSAANDINASGEVVGDSRTAAGIYHPFLWEEGTMTDLNNLIPANLGWDLTSASAINDFGQIVGYGTLNGKTRGFLLSPTPTPTPEPLTVQLSAMGAVGLICLLWRRRARDAQGGERKRA